MITKEYILSHDNTFEIGTEEWYNFIDEIVKKETGWNGLKHMCENSPTLRPYDRSHYHYTVNRLMRDAYKHITGRDAHGTYTR